MGRSIKADVSRNSRLPYYSAHFGVGRTQSLAENITLDIYGKFFWSRLERDNVHIGGSPYRFAPLDSYRLRGGARLSRLPSERITLFAGAAYEYELDGRPRAAVYDFDVPGPGMRGSTGLGELGLSFSPDKAGNFSIDLDVQGFLGKREGAAGNLRLQYAF